MKLDITAITTPATGGDVPLGPESTAILPRPFFVGLNSAEESLNVSWKGPSAHVRLLRAPGRTVPGFLSASPSSSDHDGRLHPDVLRDASTATYNLH